LVKKGFLSLRQTALLSAEGKKSKLQKILENSSNISAQKWKLLRELHTTKFVSSTKKTYEFDQSDKINAAADAAVAAAAATAAVGGSAVDKNNGPRADS
jgi:hypothetical protein